MTSSIPADVAAFGRLDAVKTALQVLRRATGMRMALVARVTPDSWTACAILDDLGLGIAPGDHLDVKTTFCNVVRSSSAPLLINHASTDIRFTDHPAWRMYGVESYVAVPIQRRDGQSFGVLCALDSNPAALTEETFEIFNLLAELIAFELEADEHQLAQAAEAEQARQTARLRDQFLSTVAHDLKNPLTSINGYAGLMQRMAQRGVPLPLARLQTSLGHIQRAAARMSASIDELMDLTRLQLDRSLELQREPVDLAALVREVAVEQQQTTDHHRIVVNGVTSLEGCWDRARIARVIQNLIGNAIRYVPDGGEIAVSVGRETRHAGSGRAEPWALVRIADRGLGVPADDLPRIFEQFHRGANVVRRVSGTGVGLFSVQQIVEQHGGQVAVESQEGHGSVFTIALPV